MKLAIFLPNWVGDAVMATPVLRAIRTDFPAANIVGVMRPVIAETLSDAGFFDRVLEYHPRGREPKARGPRFVQQLRAERCDTALLLPNSLRSACMAWMSGARRRIGFARDFRRWLLTDAVAPHSKSIPHPAIDEYLRLAQKLGCRTLSRQMTLGVSDVAQSQWNQFWNSVPQSIRDRGFVALNSGGAFGPAKNWPRESFTSLAQRIVDELGKAVVVVCGPAEQDDARWIVEQSQRDSVITIADQPLSISLTKAAIRAADLLVTTDSGPRHFAAAFDVPVITLFGPTHIAWSETFYDRGLHLQIPVDCGPCQQRVCPQSHHRCMRELSVETVFQAVQQKLTRYARDSREFAA